MARYALSKWFGNGSGHVVRFQNSDLLMITWNGRAGGTARYVPHVKRYARNGTEYKSLVALLRALETELTARGDFDAA